MKNTVIVAALLSALVMFGLQYGVLDAPAPPEPISVSIPTESSIKEEVKIERRAKAYQAASRIAAQVYRRNGCGPTYAEATGRVAVDYGLSPRILAALVFVESSCNPNAMSDSSVGLTQVNAKVWKHSRKELKNPEINLRIGAGILASNVHKYGLVKGLHAYNGFGDETDFYSNKILTAAGLSGNI